MIRGADVLLIERGKPPLTGVWSLPGGRIEPGETATAAALRELAEETGVAAEIIGLIDVHDVIVKGRDGHLAAHYVLAVYAARWLDGEPRAGDDAKAAAFVAIADLASRPLTAGADGFITRAAAMAGCR